MLIECSEENFMSLKKLSKGEISSLLDSIRDEYYNSCALKNYSKERVYYLAFSSIDAIFIELLYSSITKGGNFLDAYFPAIRNAVREELVMFKNNPSGNYDLDPIDKALFNIQKQTLKNLCEFNIIRNRLEVAYIGDVGLYYDSSTKYMEGTQESNSAMLARYEDVEKYSYNKDSFEKNGIDYFVSYIIGIRQAQILNFISGNHSKIKWLNEKQFPSEQLPLIDVNNFIKLNKDLQKLIDFVKEDYISKREVLNKYNFGEFEIDDFKEVYSCLMALCLNKMKLCYTYYISSDYAYNPTVIWKKDDLLSFIVYFSKLNIEKVRYIIEKFLVFRSDFQYFKGREYLAIYQPILSFNEYYIISSTMTLISRAQRKLIWQINKEAKTNELYRNTISEMAHEKEEVMLSEMVKFLKQTKGSIKVNVKFHSEQTKDIETEIDISLYDKQNNMLILIECKDFLPMDNEFERSKQDEKLKEFAIDRATKNTTVENNLLKYMREVHNTGSMPAKVQTIIVSNHYAGSCTEDAPIAIVSKATLFRTLKRFSFDIAKSFAAITSGDIMPSGIKTMDRITKFNGYTLKCNIVDTSSIS